MFVFAEKPISVRRAGIALGIAFLAAGLAFFRPVDATTVAYEDFASLVTKADGVVVGWVTAVEPFVGEDERIYTLVTLEVEDVAKGKLSGKTLRLRLLGGEVDGDVLEVDGSPRFEVDEEVLVFVQGNGQQIVPFVGWDQGVFRVERDAKGGKAVVTDSDGNRVLGIRGNQVVKEARYDSAVEIIGEPAASAEGGDRARVRARSSNGDATAGVTDEGDAALEEGDDAVTAAEQRSDTPMTLQELLGAVRTEVGSMGDASGEANGLADAEVFVQPAVAEQADGAIPGATEDEAMRGTASAARASGAASRLVLPRPDQQPEQPDQY